MFKKITNGCVNLVNRLLPDAFIFCIILTIIVFVAAMPATNQGPMAMVVHWGKGAWSLLGFSMQMALVLVLGNAFATAPAIKKGLTRLAAIPKKPASAIILVTAISTICCWLNWGFGLIVGALLAKEVVRRVPSVDYPLLIASAYSGFVIWHAGLSGSIPLALNSGYTIFAGTEQEMTFNATTSQTIFHPMNLIMCLVILFVMPFVLYAMHPHKDKVITVDPALLVDEQEVTRTARARSAEMIAEAETRSAELRKAAAEYVDDLMRNAENSGLSVSSVLSCRPCLRSVCR